MHFWQSYIANPFDELYSRKLQVHTIRKLSSHSRIRLGLKYLIGPLIQTETGCLSDYRYSSFNRSNEEWNLANLLQTISTRNIRCAARSPVFYTRRAIS